MKVVSTNRKARHNYNILETFEAGVVLKGDEVKSLRTKGCSIEESFSRIERGEIFIYNMHIKDFMKSSFFKTDPVRVRKLLLNKREIKKLIGYTSQKGLTLIPLKVYFSDSGIAKIQVALAKGAKLYDKRRKLREREEKREIQRELKKYRRHI